MRLAGAKSTSAARFASHATTALVPDVVAVPSDTMPLALTTTESYVVAPKVRPLGNSVVSEIAPVSSSSTRPRSLVPKSAGPPRPVTKLAWADAFGAHASAASNARPNNEAKRVLPSAVRERNELFVIGAVSHLEQRVESRCHAKVNAASIG